MCVYFSEQNQKCNKTDISGAQKNYLNKIGKIKQIRFKMVIDTFKTFFTNPSKLNERKLKS